MYSHRAFYFILSYCKQKQTTKPQAQGANPDASGKGKKRRKKHSAKRGKEKEAADHSKPKKFMKQMQGRQDGSRYQRKDKNLK